MVKIQGKKDSTAVQHKYSPYELTANERTVLHNACEGGHTDMVIYLTPYACMHGPVEKGFDWINSVRLVKKQGKSSKQR